MKLLLVTGSASDFSLEASYRRGFTGNGHEVSAFDFGASMSRSARLGSLGSTFQQYVPVDIWTNKANRDLAVEVLRYKPDVLVLTGMSKIRGSTLAFIKSATDVRILVIWPDTLLNVPAEYVSAAPFIDLVAAHSQAAVSVFRTWGFRSVKWIPFAGDLELHEPPHEAPPILYDVAFVGSNRSERESAIRHIIAKLPRLRIRVWGPYWQRSRHPEVRRIASREHVSGSRFARIANQSLINLNIIDDTNFPGSNMRFFEIPAAGGLQVCSACPEMEDLYRHDEHLYYYHSDDELIEVIESCLANPDRTERVRRAFHAQVREADNYLVRSQQLLEALEGA